MTTVGPGTYIVSSSDYGSIIDAIPTVGTNVWIELSCLPYGQDYSVRYPSSAVAGRIVSLDAGPLGVFSGINSRGVTVLHGQTVTVRRNAKNAFQVISPANPTPRVGNAYFNVSPQRFLIVGQSLGQQWEYMPAAKAFVGANNAASTQFYHMCTGGSAALKEYCQTAYPNYWWWDVDKSAPGPLLIDAINFVLNLDANLKPTHILWIQGEQDSGMYVGSGDEDDALFRARYEEAVFRILDALRVHCNMADRYSIPAHIQKLGPRSTPDTNGMFQLRLAQESLVSRAGKNIKWGAIPPLDLPLADNVHPTAAGYQILGALTGAAFN